MPLKLGILYVISWPNMNSTSHGTWFIASTGIVELPLLIGVTAFSVDMLPDAVLGGRLAMGQESRSHTLTSEQQPVKPFASQTNHW